eukprot:1133508-Pelagomonas_calceolata.AAC.4
MGASPAPIEWGTVIFGYEQANRYQVFDQDGQPVAQIAEHLAILEGMVGRVPRQRALGGASSSPVADCGLTFVDLDVICKARAHAQVVRRGCTVLLIDLHWA